MQPTQKKTLALVAGIAVALVATAGIAAYVTQQRMGDESPAPVRQQAQAAKPATSAPQYAATNQPVVVQQAPACDDKNIVGTVTGAVGGGVIGNQFGSGSGKTVATVGGAAAGAYLGNQYMPTRNATCR